MPTPSVDVVIPTVGSRPTLLAEALASVERQTARPLIGGVYVVDDRPDPDAQALSFDCDLPLTVVRRENNCASARQLGIRKGSSEWIALLDDDDIWESEKLEQQLNSASKAPLSQNRVISCRVTHQMEGILPSKGVPAKMLPYDQNVAEYLFRGRSPRADRPSIFTSTLLFSRSLAERVPWRRIPRHQDWDWLVRASALDGTKIAHHPGVLTRIRVGSPGSISRSTNWSASLEWALGTLASHADSRTTADFLASQTLRYALTGRSLQGIRQTIHAMRALDAPPSVASLTVGTAGILPTTLVRRLLSNR